MDFNLLLMTASTANATRIVNRRLFIEDSVTRVTLDGQPHITLTIIAVLSGLLVALVILGILMFLITCKSKYKSTNIKANSIANLNPIGTYKSTASNHSLCETSKVATVENIIIQLMNNSRSLSQSPTLSPVAAGSNGTNRYIVKLKQNLQSKEFKLPPKLTCTSYTENKMTLNKWQNDVQAQKEIYTQMERF